MNNGSNMKKVSAVVVTYNRIELLKENIESLLNQNTKSLNNIIIINNNSTDGTKEYLETINNKCVKIYHLNENIGGAGGFNYGMRKFIEETTDDFVWIMDDDTIPKLNALSELILASDKIGAFGYLASNVRWINGEFAKMNIPSIDSKNWLEKMDFDNAYPRIKKATFVSLLFSRSIIIKYGLPIKDFFIWGDDTEFTQRISINEPSYFVTKSVVIHKILKNEGSSIFEDSSDKSRLARYRYGFRNGYYTSKKNGKNALAIQWLYVAKTLIKLMFFKTTNRYFKIKILFKGTVQGFFFNPLVEKLQENERENDE
ncbi:glycosyltransferase family 2 protein [Lactococcus chungangensis]|uniref:glycosyltransferase family 2 protein n=1 Tax=Pseudolactococcus chungangensis TaxID=451457 RepID=UPI00373506C8